MKLLKRIWRGAGYLEGYGHHPGWSTLGIYILASGLAGTKNGGLDGFIFGILISVFCLGPFFIIGCYSRAKDYEEDVEQTFKRLQKDYQKE